MTYAQLTASTAAVPVGERREFWSDHVRDNHGDLAMRFEGSADFFGETVVQRGGGHQLVGFRSDRIGYAWSARQARADDGRALLLLLPLRGSVEVEAGEERLRLGAGRGAVLSKARPFRVSHAGGTTASVATLVGRPGVAGAFDTRTGVGAVLRDMVLGLARQRRSLGEVEFGTVCDHVAELAGLLADPSGSDGGLPALAAAVRRHVRAHVGDPDLSGTSTARALGWSLRQVQVALRAEGTTPRAVIREERVRRGRSLLSTTARSVTDVAYAVGFSSASAFGAAFRESTGESPRAYRRR